MFRSLKRLFGGEEKEEKIIAASVSGTATPMGQVGDPTFSQEILGKGTAAIPSDGRVVVPADGLMTMVFDIEHVVSMQTDNGTELIIRIGLDAIQLKRQCFEAHVATGDKVEQGDLLLGFEVGKIKEAGYDMTASVIIYNTPQSLKMECRSGMEVGVGGTAVIKLQGTKVGVD